MYHTMKKLLSVLALTAFISTAANAQYSNEKIKVGQKAPELEFARPDGTKIKLSSVYKHRYVLLDFWASWCGPCRRANPGLVALYNEYKEKKIKGAKKGFTILSVSLDQKKEPWVQAIEKDSLYWENHISDLGGWQSQPAQIYGVQYIPQAFLVGPDGKIIAKYNFAEEAAADLKRLSESNN